MWVSPLYFSFVFFFYSNFVLSFWGVSSSFFLSFFFVLAFQWESGGVFGLGGLTCYFPRSQRSQWFSAANQSLSDYFWRSRQPFQRSRGKEGNYVCAMMTRLHMRLFRGALLILDRCHLVGFTGFNRREEG